MWQKNDKTRPHQPPTNSWCFHFLRWVVPTTRACMCVCFFGCLFVCVCLPCLGFAQVAPEALTLLCSTAMVDIAHLLRSEHLRQLASILDDPEVRWKKAKFSWSLVVFSFLLLYRMYLVVSLVDLLPSSSLLVSPIFPCLLESRWDRSSFSGDRGTAVQAAHLRVLDCERAIFIAVFLLVCTYDTRGVDDAVSHTRVVCLRFSPCAVENGQFLINSGICTNSE